MSDYNVCLINDSFPPEIDGVANAVTNYARVIHDTHGSVTVVTPENQEADDSVFSFPVVRYPSIDMTKSVGYHAGLPFSPEIQERLEGCGFDIIHSHCPVTSTMLARSLRARINAPLVMTYHTKFDIDIANAVRGRLLQEEAMHILAANISSCDEVWTVSRGAGENLRRLGYRGDYIVMPNGVDLPRGRADEALIRSVCGEYDLPENVPMFLFVGRLMWYKGIRIILDALKMLSESGRDFRMVFVGGGADSEEIKAYAENPALTGRVFFVPPVHDRSMIRAWYSRADMFLFPSSFDTNGLVVREAAACGLGSVLIKGSCAAEDVTDGVDGLLIEENAGSMAELLARLCGCPELMKRVGENAQRNIYVSWDEAVERAYERYGIVIEKYSRGEYPPHESLSDEFISGISEYMDELNRRRNLQRAIISEVRQRRQNMIEELQREQERVRIGLLSEEERFSVGFSEKEKALRKKIEELTEYIERFM